MFIAFILFLGLLLTYTVVAVYAERKVAAYIQDRMGPEEVGFRGLLQTVADLLKLLQKEDIVPQAADRKLFTLAPFIIFTAVFSGFAVMPFTAGVTGSAAKVGVFFLITIISFDVLGILLAGWSSNNKYSLYGAMRSVAQIVSYEIPVTLCILCVVMVCQTLDLQAISAQQSAQANNYLFGLKALGIDITGWGGFFAFNIVRVPLLGIVFIVFFISSLAEANRAPFDLPEAESEIIGGFHTEYGGFRWALLMLSEYGMMLLVSYLSAIFFFGGSNSPLPNLGDFRLADYTTGTAGEISGYIWGAFWLVTKAFSLIFVQMWVRWTYPRLRVDQLMNLSWKYFTPLMLIMLFLCALWRMWMI